MAGLRFTRRGVLTGTAASLFGIMSVSAFAQTPAAPAADGPPPLEHFAASPVIDSIALSPDGQTVALITELKGKKYIGYFDTKTLQASAQPLGDVKVTDIVWGDNENIVITASKTVDAGGIYGVSKLEKGLAYLYDYKKNKLSQLFNNDNNPANECSGQVYRRKVGDKYFIYLMNGDARGCYISSLSMADRKFQLLFTDDRHWFDDWLMSDDGAAAFVSKYSEKSEEWELYYYKVPHVARIYGPIYSVKSKDADVGLVGWSEDGTSAVVMSKLDDGHEYFEINQKGERGKTLDANAAKFGKTAFLNPKNDRIAGFARRDDWVTYDCFDPFMARLAEAVPKLLDEGVRWTFIDFADDPRKMIVYAESAQDSGSYYFLDFTTGAAKFIAENYPDLPAEWLTEKKPIDYLAADGLKIHAYLTLPTHREAKALPLVVLPHGGPEARDYLNFDWQPQALASLGYAVLQPNYRGSSGYGLTFTAAGHGEWGRKMQTDLSDGVRDLVKQGIVDPKRVAILGASYGGYAALAGATLDPGVYNCAISIAGVADIPRMLSYDQEKTDRSGVVKYYWREYLGDPGRYNDISPRYQAAHASCPILLIHGKDDTVVEFTQSVEMNKALLDAGKTVEFVQFDGQDHWETNESARIDMMRHAVDFLKKYNPA
jgi:dipeptidyl aminopeptidase/acylaminoacyl peptidase